MTTTDRAGQCIVYRAHGRAEKSPREHPEGEVWFRTQSAEHAPIKCVMSRDLVCALPDLEIATVVSLLVEQRLGCLPIVDERRHPIGVITKFDLVEQLDATMHLAGCGCPLPADLKAQTAGDVMMPIALTLDARATVAHASSMMISERMHHVLVVSETGELIGVVSALDVVRWVTEDAVPLPRRERMARGTSPWRPLEG
jgi:CBS domain-containing protein